MKFPFIGFLALLFTSAPVAANWEAADLTPPEPAREFRAAWIATVFNIDWPSKPGLSTWRQQQELRELLDLASELKLNAVILQVRPAADAFYRSSLEPWSPFLNGKMGQGPDPFYDPLEFAVREAHQRGIELHAWINPFRALTGSTQYVAPDHVSLRQPQWVRPVKKMKWLNPADPEARAHTLKVVSDIVSRYRIDGIHIDDYFYPYPKNAKLGQRFPDDQQWQAYVNSGGKLERNAWRRREINHFVQGFSSTAKYHSPTIKVGISPFGIWRPNHPRTVEAHLDAYEHLAADSRHWLQSGWLDYFSPQLYWPTDSTEQNFHELLSWWSEQNTAGRHLWPGIASERVGPKRPAGEMLKQVKAIRGLEPKTPGHIHWSISALKENRLGLSTLLQAQAYTETALIPESPWINAGEPNRPQITFQESGLSLTSAPGSDSHPQWWLVQTRNGTSDWKTKLIPGTPQTIQVKAGVSAIAIRAVNAAGKLGPVASFIRR
jgi:uncharacterized lipoprotein YddW (UPF0748 family)